MKLWAQLLNEGFFTFFILSCLQRCLIAISEKAEFIVTRHRPGSFEWWICFCLGSSPRPSVSSFSQWGWPVWIRMVMVTISTVIPWGHRSCTTTAERWVCSLVWQYYADFVCLELSPRGATSPAIPPAIPFFSMVPLEYRSTERLLEDSNIATSSG